MSLADEHHNRDSGFTMVEVIVALVIIAILAVGAVQLFRGAGHASSSAKLRSKMYSAAESVGESMRSEKSWLTQLQGGGKGCLKGCTLGVAKLNQVKNLPIMRPEGTGIEKVDLDADVQVLGLDSKADGLGEDADRDSIWPDYYRVTITITIDANTRKEYPLLRPLIYQTVIDPTTIGSVKGSIMLQFCQATNQSDDRMVLSDCSSGADSIRMEAQPDCPGKDDNSYNFFCNSALKDARRWDSRHPKSDRSSVSVSPVDMSQLSFTLRRCQDTNKDVCVGIGRSFSKSDCKFIPGTSGVDSGCLITRLDAGQYQVTDVHYTPKGLPAMEEWKAKNLPAGRFAAVEPGEQSRALVVFRPRQGVNSIDIGFARTIRVFNVTPFSKSYSFGWGSIGSSLTARGYDVSVSEVRNVPGPAWGLQTEIQPKPFGRYSEPTGSNHTLDTRQKLVYSCFRQLSRMPTGRGVRISTITGLPTGLHSFPVVQPAQAHCNLNLIPKLCLSYSTANPASAGCRDPLADAKGHLYANRFGGRITTTPVYYDHYGECYQSGAFGWKVMPRDGGYACSAWVKIQGRPIKCTGGCHVVTGVSTSGSGPATGCCSGPTLGPVPVNVPAPAGASAAGYSGPATQSASV